MDNIESLMRTQNIDKAEDALRKIDPAVWRLQARNERLHRYHHMKAILKLGVTPWLEYEWDDGVRDPDPQADPDHQADHSAEEWAEKGIEAIRGHGALLASPLQGLVVSAGSPGGAYRPYRSVFRSLKGRAIVAGLLQSNLADANLARDLSSLRRAMKQFDQAKGGLDDRHSLLRAWADLYAAEATLLFIRRTFDRIGKDETASEESNRCFSTIHAQLLNCRTQLAGGIDALMSGRRNALWWHHCARLIAQYHTERLFVDLCQLHEGFKDRAAMADFKNRIDKADGAKPPVDRGIDLAKAGTDLLKRYTKALDAMASFVDYSINRESSRDSAWFLRTLAEVHLAAATAAAVYQEADRLSDWVVVRDKAIQILDVILKHSNENFPRTMNVVSGDFKEWVKAAISKMEMPAASRAGIRTSVFQAIRSTPTGLPVPTFRPEPFPKP